MASWSSADENDAYVEEQVVNIVNQIQHQILMPPTPVFRRVYVNRNREEAHSRLWYDYFSEDPKYNNSLFRRRFRMNRPLFLHIVSSIEERVPFFKQRRDATGRLGLSALQKCTAAIRMMAYGCAADATDEYLQVAETTATKCLEEFVNGVVNLFGDEYLRAPTAEDLQRLLDVGEQRGFPGMIGSIDCMHWEWKNCPSAWKGQYTRASGKPTIVLEAVASHDLWFWHAFFGLPGTLNDLNVLERSPVFDDLLEGRTPRVNYVVNDHRYKIPYYLTDGIYPKWSTFIQSITLPQSPEDQLFAQHQEACRKDVERAFGNLQARFAIVKNPALSWDKGKIGKILRACIILHNMIVEDERHRYAFYDPSEFFHTAGHGTSQVDMSFSSNTPSTLVNFMGVRNDVRDKRMHERLKKDLVKNIWDKFAGNQQ